MSNGLDLNIDHYTVDELVKLLRIKTPMTRDGVNSKFKLVIDKYSVDRNSGTNEYVVFFEKARDKLLCENGLANIADPPLLPYTYPTSKFITNDFNKLHNETVDDLLQNMDTTIIKRNGPRNVIEHPNLDTVPTYNQEHVAGALNPIKRRIIKKSLLIDTKFRQKYDITKVTDLNIQLPSTIKNVISMKLSSFEFPISSYVISDALKSNEMTVIYNNSHYPIKIPQGSYTAPEIETYFNTKFGTLFAGNVEANYNLTLGKFTFKLKEPLPAGVDPSGFGLDFSITSIPCESGRKLMHNLGWILGYRKRVYSNETTYTSGGQVDVDGTRYIYVLVNDYNNNVNENFISAFASSSIKANVLARIPQPAGSQEIIFNDSSDLLLKTREYFGPVNIERLHIQILDEYERIIDTNNMDYSMVLEFECVYNL